MRRYIGYRDFVERDQRSLVGTALLLTGSHEHAIRLALWSLRAVGRSWPPAPWENTTTHAQIAMYRRFLRKPTSAGNTSLVRLPPRQRVLVVACLHDGRTHAEMATALGLPVARIAAEITEAVETLTKGDVPRLTKRLATAAGEASVPDLTGQAMGRLRRRRRRGLLLTAVAALIPVGLVAAVLLFPAARPWSWALGERVSAATSPVAAPSAPTATATPKSTPTPSAGTAHLSAWRPPRTLFVIRYATAGKCPTTAASADAGGVACAGWTLKLAGGDTGRPALTSVTCGRPGYCEATMVLADAAQRVTREGESGYWRVDPAVSPDGHRIAYLSAAERRYVAHDLRTGARRYLSPVLTAADTQRGTRVSVSADGRRFTVELGQRRLRTDFATGRTTTSREEAPVAKAETAGWLREDHHPWSGSPGGDRIAAVVPTGDGADSLRIVEAGSRQVARLRLPAPGRPAASEVVGWLNAREVVVRMNARVGGGLLGFYRVDALTGQARPVTGLPGGEQPIVLGAVTTP